MDYRNANRRSFLLGSPQPPPARIFRRRCAGPARAAQAQGGRKVVMVGGKRVKVVDIHALRSFPRSPMCSGLGREGRFSAEPDFGPGRMAAMDQRGIDFEALSINQFWWYGANRDLAGPHRADA
jgi:hypothetical protein